MTTSDFVPIEPEVESIHICYVDAAQKHLHICVYTCLTPKLWLLMTYCNNKWKTKSANKSKTLIVQWSKNDQAEERGGGNEKSAEIVMYFINEIESTFKFEKDEKRAIHFHVHTHIHNVWIHFFVHVHRTIYTLASRGVQNNKVAENYPTTTNTQTKKKWNENKSEIIFLCCVVLCDGRCYLLLLLLQQQCHELKAEFVYVSTFLFNFENICQI